MKIKNQRITRKNPPVERRKEGIGRFWKAGITIKLFDIPSYRESDSVVRMQETRFPAGSLRAEPFRSKHPPGVSSASVETASSNMPQMMML